MSAFFPSSQVFPHGLPEEFTLVFTLALKKSALRDTVYLLQISDQQGYPQVLLSGSVPRLSSPPSPPPTPSLYFDLVSVSLLHTRPFSPSIYFLP